MKAVPEDYDIGMNFRLFRSIGLVVATVAVAILNAQEPICHVPARECEQQIRQMLSGRRYLGVQVVELKPGIVVKTVLPDGPAFRGALQAGDRVIAVNGRSMVKASGREFKAALADASQTGKLWMIVQRRGAYRKVEVRLEPYPQEYIDKVIAGHLSQNHTATAGAQP